ncbi:hypothetical protein [Mesobacillus selenatarsenatis]|uniref:CHAT domain-containing protein n=1 Tax=Mesobacillus selenatarsenatis TaxID=388741 RepID=A0A846TGW7_9BACI|nr:hypothetical protein [Mesobacillus selenatarsenatis]NKE04672.1 hypothetical protein [Mesobacillus selenatarsenatis]
MLKAGVFIIESLSLEDEEEKRFEGKIITEMLRMLDVEVNYKYIRTKEELKVMIKKFEESDFRYLHLSCHGNETGIGMTLDEYSFPFSEFSDMFEYENRHQRLFLSSCSAMNGDQIVTGMSETKFKSITGPLEEIRFTDSAAFWTSFYHLMFRDDEVIKNRKLKDALEKLSNTFEVQMSALISDKKGESYKRKDFGRELKLYM